MRRSPVMLRTAGALFVSALTSAACGRHDVTYQCEGGAALTAHFTGGAVRLQLPDTTVALPKVQTADGVHYGTGTYILWPKETGTAVQRGDLLVYRNCINAS